MPWLDIAGVHDADAGTLTFFAVNRHGERDRWRSTSRSTASSAKSVEHTLIRHDDLEARNTKDAPGQRRAAKGDGATLGGKGLQPDAAAAFLLDDPGRRL